MIVVSKHPNPEGGQFLIESIGEYRDELNVPMKKKVKIIPVDITKEREKNK
jgi:hypothetical protein